MWLLHLHDIAVPNQSLKLMNKYCTVSRPVKDKIGLLCYWKCLLESSEQPGLHLNLTGPLKMRNWEILFNFYQIEKKNQLSEIMKIYKCCAVLEMSLCRGTTRNCFWRLGNTLTHWCHSLKLPLTVCLLLSPGASHNTGAEQTSHLLPGDTKNFFCSGSLLSVPSVVVSNSMLLVLCQRHRRLIMMRPKCWWEPCWPSSQVQPFLHKYKSLCCGALLSSYLKCKALEGEVKRIPWGIIL